MSHEIIREQSVSPNNPQPPIYFAGGFGYGEQRNARVMHYMQTLGYETSYALADKDMSLADPRFTVAVGGLSTVISRLSAMRLAASAEQFDTLTSNYQHDKAQDLTSMIEANHPGGVRAIFQSADALNGVTAMYERPDLIDNAILAYPAGIVRQPAPIKAAKGVFKSGVSAKRQVKTAPADNFEHRDNGSRLKRERVASHFTIAASVALSDQSALLSGIRRRDNAPGVSLVLGTKDWMFSPERIIDSLRSPNDVDYVMVTDKPHGVNGRKQEVKEWLNLMKLTAEAKRARQAGTIAVKPLVDRLIFSGDIPQQKREELAALAAQVDARGDS